MALRHAVLSVLSCGGEKGGVSTEVGVHPKSRHPAALTYCSQGHLQLVQPVPQSARGLMRRIHLQGERLGKEQPRSAAASTGAAELARGRALGEALTQPRTSSRAWVKKARGSWRTSAKLGTAGSSSMVVVRFSSAATSTTRSDICGWECPG